MNARNKFIYNRIAELANSAEQYALEMKIDIALHELRCGTKLLKALHGTITDYELLKGGGE